MSNFSSFFPPILEITSWIHILTTQFPQISIWTDKHNAQVLMLTIVNGMFMSLCKVCVRL